ncbi:hypothetical protein BU24DRAFT_450077 [Aaosphaeria arxii CBS 175.79]|uniref:Altered inheritance of mitochondria protein 32 n=1 Tax=Aaosphaeria arxii CBS 175.79 TaxID=1450172 RepID=A0A6A5XRG0_9PLEO|nr:uncharacterized protein BU24DRAFT_450077 [Aaosphaeria arxii CBS 175.79]KAF2015341.1 hypothetical protein BU24DRAFT_450077 [Aaosphaeria arxii CBS 175.79]
MASIRLSTRSAYRASRAFSTKPSYRQSSPTTPHIAYTQSCPSPTCACEPTPALPEDLPLDTKTPLLHTMAMYSSQVVLCTGQPDWSSRIEDEKTPSGDFIRGMKGLIGRGGPAFDPFNNVSITASSLPPTTHQPPNTTTALLFPHFKRIPSIPHDSPSLSTFATAYLKAQTLHPAHASLSADQKANLIRNPTLADALPAAPHDITTPTVLICGHGGRDARCGILGPVLQTHFEREFERRGIEGEVAVISHIGGHKYAGNVIIYLPPGWEGGGKWEGGDALKGAGVWYGRVFPENVEGIVEETVVKGRVVVEHLRGGVLRDGGGLARVLEAQIAKEKGEDGALKLKPRARGRK